MAEQQDNATNNTTTQEPCPECGCPGEQYDGHVCEEYLAEVKP